MLVYTIFFMCHCVDIPFQKPSFLPILVRKSTRVNPSSKKDRPILIPVQEHELEGRRAPE